MGNLATESGIEVKGRDYLGQACKPPRELAIRTIENRDAETAAGLRGGRRVLAMPGACLGVGRWPIPETDPGSPRPSPGSIRHHERS